MVKICQTGLLKLKFEIIPKKGFSGFCQKCSQAMDEVENFSLLSFKSMGPAEDVRDGLSYLKMRRKSKITAP
jgi:hypothetical protein